MLITALDYLVISKVSLYSLPGKTAIFPLISRTLNPFVLLTALTIQLPIVIIPYSFLKFYT